MVVINKETEQLVEKLRLRTENYYEAHRLCCSEAIMYVFNQSLNGGLDDDTVKKMGSGFCGGMGGGDGTCGALTGAVSILGLLLGSDQKGGLSTKKLRSAAQKVHDTFKDEMGTIVCNELIASFDDGCSNSKNCQRVTGIGAAIAARVVLEHRPELAEQVDSAFIAGHDSKLGVWIKKLRSLLPF